MTGIPLASEPAADVALAIGVVALVVTMGLLLQGLRLRVQAARRAQHGEAVQALWQPLLTRAAAGEAVDLPALAPADAVPMLALWNQRQDALRGTAHEALNALLVRIGAYAIAQAWARQRGLGRRLLGVATLGHVGHAADWKLVRAASTAPSALLGFAAARALLQIDAAAAVPRVLDEFLRRSDWPVAPLGTLLRESGAAGVGPAVAERLLGGTAEQQLKLLPLALLTEGPASEPLAHQVLDRSEDPAVLALALQMLYGPASLPRVRTLLDHADWEVRSQAALALGRIGQPIDRARLIALLSDREWWVRYRAARALVAMPGLDLRTLRVLRAGLEDRYAQDMLEQVLAARELERG